MPGFELINKEEKKAVTKIFSEGGTFFAHGFQKFRKKYHVREFEIACAKKEDIDIAVAAAKKSFNSRILVDMPILDRAKLMRRIAEETRKVAKEGGNILCYEKSF